jgi:hypothetical protein
LIAFSSVRTNSFTTSLYSVRLNSFNNFLRFSIAACF